MVNGIVACALGFVFIFWFNMNKFNSFILEMEILSLAWPGRTLFFINFCEIRAYFYLFKISTYLGSLPL